MARTSYRQKAIRYLYRGYRNLGRVSPASGSPEEIRISDAELFARLAHDILVHGKTDLQNGVLHNAVDRQTSKV